MLILKRLAVWVLETLSTAFLIGMIMYAVGGGWAGPAKENAFLGVLTWAGLVLTAFMFGSGYLFTSAIFGIFYRGKRAWQYPAIAAGLFVIHLQFFATGWTQFEKLSYQALGVFVVLACDFAGNLLLRKWATRPHVQETV